MTDDLPAFDDLVDALRVRLGDADALEQSRIHSFKELMLDYGDANLIADGWYWEAFDELEAHGHLDAVSHKVMGGDARGRLSAEGRWFLRESED